MSEWLPILPALVAAIVSLIILFRQEKSQKVLAELKHTLSKEMFFTEKVWNEKRDIYLQVLEVSSDISFTMEAISVILESSSPHSKIGLIYQFHYIMWIQIDFDWDKILQEAIEDERKEIELIRNNLIPRTFRDSRNKLISMRTLIWLFASPETKRLWRELVEISEKFQEAALFRIIILMESSLESNSKAEITSFELISHALRVCSKTHKDSVFLELKSIWADYVKTNTHLNEQMRKELHLSYSKPLS